MDKEFNALSSLLADKKEMQILGKNCIEGKLPLMQNAECRMQNQRSAAEGKANEVLIMQSGIGKVNAAIGVMNMINTFKPDVVVSSGCAGGADINLEIGDVVVSSSCQYHDVYCGPENLAGQVQGMPSEFETPQELVDKALSVNEVLSDTKVVAGKIATGDWFVDSVDKMKLIHSDVADAKAVDMESCAIAQTCFVNNIPFVSFRVISDIPLKENNAADYADFWATMAEKSFTVNKEFLNRL